MKNVFLSCTVILIPILALLIKMAFLDEHIRRYADRTAKEK